MLQTLHSPPDLRRSDMAYSAAAAPDPQNIVDRLIAAPQSFQLPELPALVEALYSLPEQLLAGRALIAGKINNVLEIFWPQLNLQQPRDDHQAIAQLKFLQLCLVNDHADPVPYTLQPVPGSQATPHLNGHHSRRASERDKPLNQELVELFLCSLYKYPEFKTEVLKGDVKDIMELAIRSTIGMLNNRVMLSQGATILGIINWRFYFTIYDNASEQVYKFKIHTCLQNLSKYFPAQVYVRLMGNYQALSFGHTNLAFYDMRGGNFTDTNFGVYPKPGSPFHQKGSELTGADFSGANLTKTKWGGCYVHCLPPKATNIAGSPPSYSDKGSLVLL